MQLRLWLLASFLLIAAMPALGNAQASAGPPTARGGPSQEEIRLIEAETRNQDAQSRYYHTVAGSAHDLFPAVPGLLGAVIGASLSFFGLLLHEKKQNQVEHERWSREKAAADQERALERAADHRKEIRMAAADLAKRIAAGAHSITWTTWIAKYDPDRFSGKLIDEHDSRMNSLYSELVAAQVVLAALDAELFDTTSPVVQALYNLDGKLGRLATKLPDTLSHVGQLWLEAKELERQVPQTFLGLFDPDAHRKAPFAKLRPHKTQPR